MARPSKGQAEPQGKDIPILRKARRPSHPERWDYTILSGTSQGRVFDIPPEHWIEGELYQFDAKRNSDTVKPPKLCQAIHPVFAAERWGNISNVRHKALQQSMMLASILINLSGPAFACFFPRFRQNPKRGVRASVVPDDEYEYPRPNHSAQWVSALRMFEEDALRSISWWEDSEMYREHGWLSINMPDNATPPFSPKDQWDWDEADEEAGSSATRRVRIGLPTEFADTILANRPGSAKHLLATFYAGITMMHELGHWCVSHVPLVGTPGHGEPYFGDHIEMEMGNSWVAWLFGCQMHPEPIIGEDANRASESSELFNHGLRWLPTHLSGATKPVYETQYSVPLSYVETIMSAETWKGHDLSSFTAPMRREVLGPKREMFREGHVARVATAYRPRYWSNEAAFARPGQARHINWDHAPLRYADLLLSEKKRPGQHRRKSLDAPSDFHKLMYKLKALSLGSIPDERKIVHRETDDVGIEEGYTSDELEAIDHVSPTLHTPGIHDDIHTTSDDEQDHDDIDVVIVHDRPVLHEPSTISSNLKSAHDDFSDMRTRAVSTGRVTKSTQRPRSIMIAEAKRKSAINKTLADIISHGQKLPKRRRRSTVSDSRVRPKPPILVDISRRSSMVAVGGNDPSMIARSETHPRRKRSSTSSSPRTLSGSRVERMKKSPAYTPAAPSLPTDSAQRLKFYTRLSKVRKVSPSAIAHGRRKSTDSSTRRASSEVSRDAVTGRGTALSPRRFGNKGKLLNIPRKLGPRPTHPKNSDPSEVERALARPSEAAEASIKTPQWEQFALHEVRTRSQSRSIEGQITRRGTSSGAILSPMTLGSEDRRRRESSMVWENKYGRGQKGWDTRPFPASKADDEVNRRKSSGFAR